MNAFNPKTVVMTGSHGFIGTHLTRALTEQGYQVVPLGPPHCALADATAVSKFFADTRPEIVFHLAGLSSPGRDLNSMEAHYASNTAPAINLARCLPEWAPRALFFWSCAQ